MLLSNTEEIPGKEIVELYGVVTGSTVRAKNIGRDIAAGLKNLVGGELRAYTELLTNFIEIKTIRRRRRTGMIEGEFIHSLN